MIKIIDNKNCVRPLTREHKKITVGYPNPIPDATSYLMQMEITGNPGERNVLLSTGYKDREEYTNTFIFAQNSLADFIKQLEDILQECEVDNDRHLAVETAYQELYKYIKMGIIEGINLHKIAEDYPNYSSMLYIPFRVEPKFKSIQEIKELELQDEYKNMEVNIGLQFIDCFHIDFHDANPMIDKLTNKHRDIPITFSNYDLNAEYKKFRERLLSEVKGFTPKKKKEHDKKMEAKAKELGIIEKEDIPQSPGPGVLGHK